MGKPPTCTALDTKVEASLRVLLKLSIFGIMSLSGILVFSWA